MAAMIAWFEMDFSLLLETFMDERDFKVTNVYPFPFMIFSLCRSSGVPIRHIDKLKTPLSTIGIGIIRDEANELSPPRGPRPVLPPLVDNLADMVAQARVATHAASEKLTLRRSSLSRVVTLLGAPLAQPISRLWSCLLGSRN